jgi:hypothetical protein
MKKENIDISVLMFDPWDKNTVSRLEEYDEFKQQFGVEKQKAIAYIILVYDLKTQLRKEYPFFNQRKVVAAELAGFPKKKDGKFTTEYENILIGKNERINKAISKYIRLFYNPKYLYLVYYWSILSLEHENINNKKESSDFKNTIANIEKLESKIESLEEYLYGGKDERDVVQALYEEVEKENLRLKPENIALEDPDELIGEGPYGDYKPEELKYKGHK